MKKIGIYYGSTTGSTQGVAEKIGVKLNVAETDIKDIAKFSSDEFQNYDVLILGTSTWGEGDLQDDWYDALDEIKNMDLSSKQVALFGCGDGLSYPDSFCGAMGTLHDSLGGTGCTFIGSVATDGYDFSDSQSLVDGSFVGLPLDEDNEDNQTDSRIEAWVEELQNQM